MTVPGKPTAARIATTLILFLTSTASLPWLGTRTILSFPWTPNSHRLNGQAAQRTFSAAFGDVRLDPTLWTTIGSIDNDDAQTTWTLETRADSGDLAVRTWSLRDTGKVSLFASLRGPGGARQFGCYLVPVSEDTHVCENSGMLEAGQWEVNLVLVRRHKSNNGDNKDGTVKCTLRPGSEEDDKDESLGMVDYLKARQFSSFNEILSCFEYPFSVVWNATWTHTPRTPQTQTLFGLGSSKVTSCGEFTSRCPICNGGGNTPTTEGRWIAIPKDNEPSTDLDQLYPDKTILSDARHQDPHRRFIFTPFSCRYRMIRPKEAAQCLREKRPMFVGDSRLQGLRFHIVNWLRNASEKVDISPMAANLNDRLALARYLHADGGGREQIAAALKQGRTIVINSLLHDIASLEKRNLTVEEANRYLGNDQCGSDCHGTVDICNCTEKRHPVETYLGNVANLAYLLKQTPPNSPGKFIWLTMDRRPPSTDPTQNPIWGWQTPDVTLSLESSASHILSSAWHGHVDLRGMMSSADPVWYDDPVHFEGKWGRPQLMMHMAVQMVLSEICL